MNSSTRKINIIIRKVHECMNKSMCNHWINQQSNQSLITLIRHFGKNWLCHILRLSNHFWRHILIRTYNFTRVDLLTRTDKLINRVIKHMGPSGRGLRVTNLSYETSLETFIILDNCLFVFDLISIWHYLSSYVYIYIYIYIYEFYIYIYLYIHTHISIYKVKK